MKNKLNNTIEDILNAFAISVRLNNPQESIKDFNDAVIELSKLLEEKKLEYENKAGESCVILAKILSQKQLKDISDDCFSFASMNVEAKRKQDEINYIRYLQEQAKEGAERVIRRVVKILEEYEVKKEPLCEQNILLKRIKERVIRN